MAGATTERVTHCAGRAWGRCAPRGRLAGFLTGLRGVIIGLAFAKAQHALALRSERNAGSDFHAYARRLNTQDFHIARLGQQQRERGNKGDQRRVVARAQRKTIPPRRQAERRYRTACRDRSAAVARALRRQRQAGRPRRECPNNCLRMGSATSANKSFRAAPRPHAITRRRP